MTCRYIRVTYGWHRSTYEWHRSTYEWHADDIWVTYEWHTSTYEWDRDDIQVGTSDIRMTYEYIRVTYAWHTGTCEWHTDDMWFERKIKLTFFNLFDNPSSKYPICERIPCMQWLFWVIYQNWKGFWEKLLVHIFCMFFFSLSKCSWSNTVSVAKVSMWYLFFFSRYQIKQETLRVVTFAMIYSTLTSLWRFQCFQRPIYTPVEHLWWSSCCENSKPLCIFTKKMLAWVLNTPLLCENPSNFIFL